MVVKGSKPKITEGLLWELIENSKQGNAYLNPHLQTRNFAILLSRFTPEERSALRTKYGEIAKKYKTREFDKLHVQNGGFVNAGDDGFYMDFFGWVMAQGYPLYKKFREKGAVAIKDYVTKLQQTGNFQVDDLYYESFVYAFQGK